MATKHPDSASRLGGVLISNQVVAELLEQLRNGIWQDTDHLPPELELANDEGSAVYTVTLTAHYTMKWSDTFED